MTLGSRLDALADDLRHELGDAAVVVDPDVTARYRTDWTGRHGGYRALVARPDSTESVATTLAAAAARGIGVVTQGGNTGLVGGSVPGTHDLLILSTERLSTIEPIDAATGQITVGAGVTLGALASHLAGSGWRYAVDLAARDSATIGGTIATNAGGMRVFRYGSTRRQVLGLEYVTVDGVVVSRLGGLRKDNTGYDLASLLCGSEGTLAVLTRARLRLVPELAHTATAMLGFATPASAFDAAWALRRECPAAEVIEFLDGACVDLVRRELDLARPVVGGAVLLIEAAATADPTEELAAAIALVAPAADVAVAGSAAQRTTMWRLRDDLTVVLAAMGSVMKFDVSIPATAVAAFMADAEALIGAHAHGATCWWFGHVCDDNLHLNVTGVDELDDDSVDEVEDRVLALVQRHHGSISAEHGIGRTKAHQLHRARTPAEIAQMRAVKTAFDPDGLLNPGVLFPPERRRG